MKLLYKMVGLLSLQKLRIREFHGDQEGLSTVEYVILVVLVAVLGIGAWELFGQAIADKIG